MSVSVERSDLSVLHIGAGRYKPGDTHHSTFDIWRELAKGFRRYTVVGRSYQNSFSRMEEGNLAVCLLPSYFASEAEFLFSQAKAIKIGEEVNADIVVAQCPVKGGLAGIELSRRRGAKLLSELHGFEYFAAARIGSSQWSIQFMTGYPLKHSQRIRALSEGMKRRIIARYGTELESKIVCLPPRVDLKRFNYVKQDWAIQMRPKLLMVGAVNENKGQRRLVSILLSARIDVEIWIVGDGPDLQIVRKIAENLGGADRVKFLGRLAHTDLARLLPQADVFVMFSQSEGTPRAIMEGMAAGLPIITTNAGFCADVVENGVQGFVLGDDPTAEIVQCLERLLGDDELRARMGQAARARAEAEFDADKLYERYRALIRETAEA